MGQNSKRRREEKLRAERRRQEEKRAQSRTEPSSGPGRPAGASSAGSSEFATLRALVLDATAGLTSKDLRFYDRAIDRLVLWSSTSSSTVDLVSTVVLAEMSRHLRVCWRRGWQPIDVVSVVRRMDSAAHGTVVAAAVVHDAKHDRDLPTHPQWTMQLEELTPWWDERDAAPPSWLERVGSEAGLARRAVLEHCVAVMARVLTFGTLPTLIPPPGPGADRATSGSSHRRNDNLDPKMLSKVRALLAKAESTEFPEEADSLTEKAQQLMTRYSIDAAMVDASATIHDGPEGRRIHLDAPYADAKGSLVGAVASANRCRVVLDGTYGFANVFGFATDLALVDVLFTSLLAQATVAMVAAGRSPSQYGSTTSKSFRRSFLLAYAGRIRERLREAAAASTKEAESEFGSSMLPVLVRRETDVEAMVTSVFPKTTPLRRRISNEGGWIAGREAADKASLDTWGAVRATSAS